MTQSKEAMFHLPGQWSFCGQYDRRFQCHHGNKSQGSPWQQISRVTWQASNVTIATNWWCTSLATSPWRAMATRPSRLQWQQGPKVVHGNKPPGGTCQKSPRLFTVRQSGTRAGRRHAGATVLIPNSDLSPTTGYTDDQQSSRDLLR